MEDWKIQPRNHFCSECQNPFQEKEVCFTVLNRVATEMQRKDFCPSCWSSLGGPMIRDKAGVLSYWQGSYEPPPPPPPDPLPKEDAESILRKMIQRNDPEEREARYILAVMLERKKILRHRETQNAEERMLVYEHIASGEVFAISDPQLRLDQLPEIQRRVAAMLNPKSEEAPAVPAPAG